MGVKVSPMNGLSLTRGFARSELREREDNWRAHLNFTITLVRLAAADDGLIQKGIHDNINKNNNNNNHVSCCLACYQLALLWLI